jgi:branched-chain amino acid aminotransferase
MLWYKEKLVKADEVNFDLSDRGLLLGDGLFETITAFNHIPFQLEAHLERMIHSAQRLGMPLNRSLLQDAVLAVAGLNEAPCVIRITASRGTGPRGLLPPDQATPLVFATRAAWHDAMAFGQSKLATVSIRRNPTSPTSSMKTLAYLDSVLSLQEAKAKGADDALIVSTSGSIACTSMANLFILNQNSLVTPALDGSVLPGITRQLILDIAPKLGLTVSERACSVAELFDADLVMSSNSVRFLTKITAVDETPLSTHSPEPWIALKNAMAESVSEQCGGFALTR